MVGGRGKDMTNLEAVKEDIEMSWTSSDEDDEEVLALMTVVKFYFIFKLWRELLYLLLLVGWSNILDNFK